jgi:hypothetical protein
MGNGDPEVPELSSVQGLVYSWATLSPGDINSETLSSRLRVGRWANKPTSENKLNVKKPDAMHADHGGA